MSARSPTTVSPEPISATTPVPIGSSSAAMPSACRLRRISALVADSARPSSGWACTRRRSSTRPSSSMSSVRSSHSGPCPAPGSVTSAGSGTGTLADTTRCAPVALLVIRLPPVFALAGKNVLDARPVETSARSLAERTRGSSGVPTTRGAATTRAPPCGWLGPSQDPSRLCLVRRPLEEEPMGDDIAPIVYTREQRQAYRVKVRRCLDVFERMLIEHSFDFERSADRSGDRAQPRRPTRGDRRWPTPRCSRRSPTRTSRPSSAATTSSSTCCRARCPGVAARAGELRCAIR